MMTPEKMEIQVQVTANRNIAQDRFHSIERIRQALPLPQNTYETVLIAKINEDLDAERNAWHLLDLMGVQFVGRLP
jgi:hypothetical protein